VAVLYRIGRGEMRTGLVFRAIALGWPAVVMLLFGVTVAFRFLALKNGFANDHFIYISAGRQMLFGEWPTRDFVDPGQPLMFAASALFQDLLGPTLLAEGMLVSIAFGLGAALTALAVRQLTGSIALAVLAALLEIAVFPRTYSYPKVAVYALVLWLYGWYLSRPDLPRLFAMASGVAIAFLFRHDHGLYLGTGAVLAIVLAGKAWRTAVRDGAMFAVVVTNSVGSVTSAAARLTITPKPPGVTVQDVTVNEGQTATFVAAVTSSAPVTYQWRKNGQNISGATSATFTTAATTPDDDGTIFSVVVSNSGGSTTSTGARLTVRAAPRVVTPPQPVSVAEGQAATFTVTASGAGTLAYQWRVNAVDIPGATASSFTTGPLTVAGDSGHLYSVRVSNDFASVTSGEALLTVTGVNHPPAPSAPDPTSMFELDTATVQVAHGDPDVGQSHTFAIGVAPAHGTATVSATGLVSYSPAAGFRGSDSLQVTVTDNGVPPLSGTVQLHFNVLQALFLTLTANPDPIVNFGTVTYELRVSNQGTAPAANVLLSDTVPSIAKPVAAEISGGGTCAGACTVGSVVSWPAFTLAAGETRTVTLAASLNGGTNGAVLHDSAQVTYAGGTLTAAFDGTVRTAAGISVALSEDHDPVRPGDQLTYTVTAGTATSGVDYVAPPKPTGVNISTPFSIERRTTSQARSPSGSLEPGSTQATPATSPLPSTDPICGVRALSARSF